MEKLVTANVASSLYWLGRYLERTEATLYKVIKAYDEIIDVNHDAGVNLYKNFDVVLEYKNANNFLRAAIFGEHTSNLLEVMINARESAIISRHLIDTEAFGEIIELHALFLKTSKEAQGVDYRFIDVARSLIREIWGTLSEREHKKNADDFVRLGKLVEEADFRIRFGKDESVTMTIIDEIDMIVESLSNEDYKSESMTQDQGGSEENLLNFVNNKIKSVIID
jgi:uncharacterized alpha-E superfamily protein